MKFAEAILDGEVTLFTGSGFSCDALDRDGRSIPSGDELRSELWSLCFPDEPEDQSSLADLFSHAHAKHPDELGQLLERRLVIDPRTLPDHYEVWFSMPWRRAYTLNVDDLESAAARRFSLPRPIRSLSALSDRDGGPSPAPSPSSPLEFVHLNGTIGDGPNCLTFSTLQYAQRIVGEDPWYAALGKDLDRGRFLFVGTRLDESPLWQHVEHYGRRLRKPPPARSLLVTTHLTRARRSLLEDLAIDCLHSSTREFAEQHLAPFLPRVRKP